MRPLFERAFAAVFLAASVVACSSGGGSSLFPTGVPSPAASASPHSGLTVTIRVPSKTASYARTPRFIASTTQSALLSFTPQGGGASQSFAVALTPAQNPNCTTTSGGTSCSIVVSLGVGAYTGSVTTYDGPLASGAPSGNVLGRTGGVAATVNAGGSTLNLTLYGIPASVSVSASAAYPSPGVALTAQTAPPAPIATASGGGYALNRCFGSMGVTINARDADGNLIVGAGAPVYSLQANASTIGIVTPAPAASANVFTVVPSPVPTRSAAITLTARATSGDSGATAVATAVPIAVSGDLCVKILAGRAGVFGTTDGPGANATFTSPSGLVYDTVGNLYVTEQSNGILRRIAPDGTVSTLAGVNNSLLTSATCSLPNGGPGLSSFNAPQYVTVASDGTLYITDYINNSILRVTPGTFVVQQLAGCANASGSTNGPYLSAKFYSPYGIAIDPTGTFWVADSANNQIRKLSGGNVSLFTGATQGINNIVDGTGSVVRHCNPRDVLADPTGTYLYILEGCFPAIRRATIATTTVTTLVQSNPVGATDGGSTTAKFNNVQAIALDPVSGNLLVPDHDNGLLRIVSGVNGPVSGVTVTTLAGRTPAALLEGPLSVVNLGNPLFARYSLDGSTIVFSDDLYFLVRVIR